ncbi:ornithine carbamoyltransferase [Prauserella muralis]|uniref:Ornithine carbamoyltransferase n=1 Tax=Prauserella muralis TaxID=588067 RepID=A0A2V4AJR4_9PSEU|nr:ornithine carbamoyltransferase [Prauserella muralis]PXY19416.1 ornithine carbamoyltransferase [Prauserella muralis]TWE29390.1 ornithine carbamoyltransferase [Prauserella muralis]
MRNLLTTAELSTADFGVLMRLAEHYAQDRDHTPTALRNRLVALHFTKPSTRTRVSTEAAVTRLGGVPTLLAPGELQLGRGETIEDTARVLSSYVAAIVIRTASDEQLRRFAGAATVPVVNALTDGHHPLQSLTDLFTLRQVFGDLRGRRIAYVGAGNNVAVSLAQAAALAGVDIALATPEEYPPDAEGLFAAERIAATTGSTVERLSDPAEAVRDASAVYTDVWLSMGDPPEEAEARRIALKPYRVDKQLMLRARSDAVFLHCLPAHRGEEVSAEVIDDGQSVVFRQAANRQPVAQAVLYALLCGRLVGQGAAR